MLTTERLVLHALRSTMTVKILPHLLSHFFLQNPEDKREIICDPKLKSVMGGKSRVTMFNMNRYITDHLLEKLDRSAYTHEESAAAAAKYDDQDSSSEEEESSEEESD